MNIWGVMNIVAWLLCAVIIIYLAFDVIRLETGRVKKEKKRGPGDK